MQLNKYSSADLEAYQLEIFLALKPSLVQLKFGDLSNDLAQVFHNVFHLLNKSTKTSIPLDLPLDRHLAEYILYPILEHLRHTPLSDYSQQVQEHVLYVFFLVWNRLPPHPTCLNESTWTHLVNGRTAINCLEAVSHILAVETAEDILCQAFTIILCIIGHPYTYFDPFDDTCSLPVTVRPQILGNWPPNRYARSVVTRKFETLPLEKTSLSCLIALFPFARILTNTLDIIQNQKLVRLRWLGMAVVNDLLFVLAEDPDVVGFVLPGAISALSNITTEPNSHSGLVATMLELLSRLITVAMTPNPHELNQPKSTVKSSNISDKWDTYLRSYLAPYSNRPESIVGLDHSKKANQLLLKNLFTRSSQWFVDTIPRLNKFLSNILESINLSQAHSEVLLSACLLCEKVALNCNSTLNASHSIMFQFVAGCTLSDFVNVCDLALTCIERFSVYPQVPEQALVGALETLIDLASVADEIKVKRLACIRGCLIAIACFRNKTSGESSLDSFISPTLLTQIILAWTNLLVVDSIEPIRLETASKFRRWNFVTFHSVEVADAVWDTIKTWVSLDGESFANAVIEKMYLDSSEFAQTSTFPHCDKDSTIDNCLYTNVSNQSADAISVIQERIECTRKTRNNPHSTPSLINRQSGAFALFAVVLSAFPSPRVCSRLTSLLESTSDHLALSLVMSGLEIVELPSYVQLVRDHLATLLVYCASLYRPLSISTESCVNGLGIRLGCETKTKLIDKYASYLKHRIHNDLLYPLLHPELPKLMVEIASTMRGGGSSTEWFEEFVEPIIAIMEQHLNNSDIWHNYTMVLLEVVEGSRVNTPETPITLSQASKAFPESKGACYESLNPCASPWIKYAFGPSMVQKTLVDKNKSTVSWGNQNEIAGHDKQANPSELFDDEAHTESGSHQLASTIQTLLLLLRQFPNLIHLAPVRTRVELLRLAANVVLKLNGQTKHTQHLIYRILKTIKMTPSKYIGVAEQAYLGEATCSFIAAVSRHSPNYAAAKSMEYFGMDVIALAKLGIPSAIDAIFAAAVAENNQGRFGSSCVLTPLLAEAVVKALLPQYLLTWKPTPSSRFGHMDVRLVIDHILVNLLGADQVTDVVWMTMTEIRASIIGIGDTNVIEPTKFPPCSETSMSKTVDWNQVAKLDVMLL